MISPSHSTKVFMCRKPVDFRSGYDRLANICKMLVKQNPYDGSVFLFFNRDYTRAKIIYYDGTGAVMIWKRLEVGRFNLPQIRPNRDFASINGTDLLVILEGLNAQSLKRNKKKSWVPQPELRASAV